MQCSRWKLPETRVKPALLPRWIRNGPNTDLVEFRCQCIVFTDTRGLLRDPLCDSSTLFTSEPFRTSEPFSTVHHRRTVWFQAARSCVDDVQTSDTFQSKVEAVRHVKYYVKNQTLIFILLQF